ncbi:hypothetical protein RUM44_011304 [Polyplax serrata]|uniref:Biogenesis of lysosome-related organelles complex 1 subunit 7 n=1 Tax=Polyplax serrata TaxID=468196 RepID=A0ABR1APN4_POLSC
MEANDESDIKQSVVFNEDNINSCNIAQELYMLGTVIDEAINKQTEATTSALKMLSQIENLFASQQKLEIYISSKCESRRLLESKLDKLEVHIIPQVTQIATYIRTTKS